MEEVRYAALVLAWALPVVLLEWAFGWRTLVLEWRPLVATVIMATAYLGCADVAAVRDGIWAADPAKTLGLSAGGFVFEDWLAILAANTMIAQTVILALDDDLLERLAARLRRR